MPAQRCPGHLGAEHLPLESRCCARIQWLSFTALCLSSFSPSFEMQLKPFFRSEVIWSSLPATNQIL